MNFWNLENKNQLAYVVVDEHTIGFAIPNTPNHVAILNSSQLRGAGTEQSRGVHLWTKGKNVRLARIEDWETFNLHLCRYQLKEIEEGTILIQK